MDVGRPNRRTKVLQRRQAKDPGNLNLVPRVFSLAGAREKTLGTRLRESDLFHHWEKPQDGSESSQESAHLEVTFILVLSFGRERHLFGSDVKRTQHNYL